MIYKKFHFHYNRSFKLRTKIECPQFKIVDTFIFIFQLRRVVHHNILNGCTLLVKLMTAAH